MSTTKIGEFVTVGRDGPIATVTFDRGDGRNPLSRQLILELTETAKSFADDLKTHAVILTANGAFTAGADLKDSAMSRNRPDGLLERRHMIRIGPELCDAWERVEQVTICAIEKYCIGGGAALLFAPLLLQPLPDSFVNGRRGLLVFAAGAVVLAALMWRVA